MATTKHLTRVQTKFTSTTIQKSLNRIIRFFATRQPGCFSGNSLDDITVWYVWRYVGLNHSQQTISQSLLQSRIPAWKPNGLCSKPRLLWLQLLTIKCHPISLQVEFYYYARGTLHGHGKVSKITVKKIWTDYLCTNPDTKKIYDLQKIYNKKIEE